MRMDSIGHFSIYKVLLKLISSKQNKGGKYCKHEIKGEVKAASRLTSLTRTFKNTVEWSENQSALKVEKFIWEDICEKVAAEY